MDIKCTKCRQTKSEFEFHNDSTAPNGKKSRCKTCAKEANDLAKARRAVVERKRTARSDPKMDWDLQPSWNTKMQHQSGTLNGPLGQLGREYRVERYAQRTDPYHWYRKR